MRNFISPHLHAESHLSASTTSSFLKKAKKMGLPYLSVTDQGNMYSAFKAYAQFSKDKIKPIIGVEFYFKDIDCPLIKGTKLENAKYFTVTVHAKDEKAYSKLSSVLSKKDGLKILIDDKYYPTINWDNLEEISKENVTVVIGGPNCLVAKPYLINRADISMAYFKKLQDMFGSNLYVSLVPFKLDHSWKTAVTITVNGKDYVISGTDRVETNAALKVKATELVNTNRHNFIKSLFLNRVKFKVNKPVTSAKVKAGFVPVRSGDILLKVNKLLLSLAKNAKMEDRLLISSYSYYPDKKDKAVQDMKLGEEVRVFTNYYMASTEEVVDYLKSNLSLSDEFIEKMVDNSYVWASNFDNFTLNSTPRFPKCEEDSLQKLMSLIKTTGRMKWDNQVYKDRLAREIEVLKNNGTIDLLPYFFPIAQVFDEYKKFGELTGPGRGSAAGSLICYLIGITHVDPIARGLSFERFLTLQRIKGKTLPDIDSDLPTRDLLVGAKGQGGFLTRMWPNKWAQSSTRGLLRLKSSMLDANRFIKGELEEDIQKLSKSLPPAPQGTSDQDFVFGYEKEGEHVQGLLELSESLKKYAESRPEEWELVQKCLGVTKSIGKHASAFFISDEDIDKIVATTTAEGVTVTHSEAKYAESVAGLIKYDFLCLNTLVIIQSCLRHINNKNNENLEIGKFTHKGQELFIWDLPEYGEVFDDICQGKTETLFQLNTKSMLPHVLAIQPRSVDDIATIAALVRPGPLDFVDEKTGRNMAEEFAERKAGRSFGEIQVLNQMIPETYGILVYQEQITRIARELGQMDAEAAENVRIAMGKKQMQQLQALKPIFIEGAAKTIPLDEATKIWDMMEAFGRYGFNCIGADQKVQTDIGMKNISDIVKDIENGTIDYKVAYFDGSNVKYEKPSFGKNMGKKEVWEVELEDGTIVKATPDHRFLSGGKWYTLKEIIENNMDIDKI